MINDLLETNCKIYNKYKKKTCKLYLSQCTRSSTVLAFWLTLDNGSDSESLQALELRGKCDLDSDPSPDPDSNPVGDACLCLVCLWFVTRIDIDGLTEDFRRPAQITLSLHTLSSPTLPKFDSLPKCLVHWCSLI